MWPTSVFQITLCSLLAACTALGTGLQWPNNNRGYDAERFSPLTEITTANAETIAEVCELTLGDDGKFQSGPLLVDDMLFVTTSHTTVALNAADCSLRWRHIYMPKFEISSANRGLGYWRGRLFRGTGDGLLLSLDARTGKELWRRTIASPDKSEFVSAAPIVWDNLVFIGPAGGDWGARGRVVALNASTGREVWRFNTIPMAGEPGAETWIDRESTNHGGGATWSTYTLDPARGEVFISVGNPGPDFNPESRPGANLYTDSLVVLNARNGKLKWFFQVNPNEAFDWDLGAAPVLYADRNGHQRVAVGSKNGYVYGLERANHALIFKTPVTTLLNQDKRPTSEGVRVCPGTLGGVEWNGPAFSPLTGDLYVGAVDWCSVIKSGPPKFEAGKFYIGTDARQPPNESALGWITAMDGDRGTILWQYRADAPVVAGVTPTAAGIVFSGDLKGNFLALDAHSGRLLRKLNLGGGIAGGVITYSIDGKQYVAATVGNTSRAWNVGMGTPRLVVLSIGMAHDYVSRKLSVPNQPIIAASDPQRGPKLFAQFCSACHGAAGEGMSGPTLQHEALRKDREQVIDFLKNPGAPMPRLFPDPLTDTDLTQVAEFVESL